MKTLATLMQRAVALRERYHALELRHHGSIWSIEEDALAFLTDAGLVGRWTMARAGRWPVRGEKDALEHKLAECIWWLLVLAKRHDIDIVAALDRFLTSTERKK